MTTKTEIIDTKTETIDEVTSDDNTGFRMTDDGKIFHHGMFIGRITHERSYRPHEGSIYFPWHEYAAQGIEIRSGSKTEYRSIASQTKASMKPSEVIEIEVANR